MTLNSITDSGCKECPLWEEAMSVCLKGRGDPNSGILIIGENPAKEEDNKGLPFVGESGKLLEDALVQAGFKDIPFGGMGDRAGRNSGPYITNTVKCITSKNRKPTVNEINACQKYLKAEIDIIKPKMIIALGNSAQYLFTNKCSGIESIRGKIEETEYGNVLYTYHPAAILYDRSGGKVKSFISDLQKAKAFFENPSDTSNRVDFELVDTEEKLSTLVDKMNASKFYAIDLETNDLKPHRDNPEIICISLAFEEDFGYLIWIPSFENPQVVWDAISSSIEDPSTKKILANAKFDALWLKVVAGLQPKGFQFDIIVMHHLLYPNIKTHSLKYQAGQFLSDGHYDDPIKEARIKAEKEFVEENRKLNKSILRLKQCKNMIEDLLAVPEPTNRQIKRLNDWRVKAKEAASTVKELRKTINVAEEKVGTGFSGVDKEVIAPYAVKDAVYTFRICKILLPMIKKGGFLSVYKLASELSEVLVEVEACGFAYDENEAHRVLGDYKERLEKAMTDLQESEDVAAALEITGKSEFNPRSTKQLDVLFHDVLNLDSPSKTPTGAASYSDNVLREWTNKAAQQVTEIRHLTKMKSTYLENIIKDIYNGRYYPDFNSIGTISGRLASGFHTFPKNKEDIQLRRPFVSSFLDGYLVEVDESQLELRVAAHVYNDEAMLEIYKQGIDLHTRTASITFNIDEDKVDKMKHRQIAKVINFSIVYGITPWALATRLYQDTGLIYTDEEAAEFIRDWLKYYTGIKSGIIDITRRFGAGTYEDQHITTSIFGREVDLAYSHSLDGDRHYNPQRLSLFKKAYGCKPFSYSQRLALNFPIQSVGSDITILGIITTHNKLCEYDMKSRIVGMVHDSMVLDVPKEELDDVIKISREAFINPPIEQYFPGTNFSCPLDAGIAVGKSLGNMEEVD